MHLIRNILMGIFFIFSWTVICSCTLMVHIFFQMGVAQFRRWNCQTKAIGTSACLALRKSV